MGKVGSEYASASCLPFVLLKFLVTLFTQNEALHINFTNFFSFFFVFFFFLTAYMDGRIFFSRENLVVLDLMEVLEELSVFFGMQPEMGIF